MNTSEASSIAPTAARGARLHLLKRLRRRAKAGDRLPPLRDLARELDIGLGSVNQAVQMLVREGVLVSRPGLGTYVADTRQLDAPAQASGVSGKLIRLFHNPVDGMIRQIHHGLAGELSRRGFRIDVRETRSNASLVEQSIGADALVQINPDGKPEISVQPGQHLLIIQTSAELPVAPGTDYDEVTADQEQGAALAGKYLRDLGCRSVCFVGVKGRGTRDRFARTSRMRLEAFERAWGTRLPDVCCLRQFAYCETYGARAVENFLALPQRPDAVFAASDDLAIGFISGALAHGLEPGRDYQIVGFDGQQRGRDLAVGPLTTVAAPVELMGRRGAELLADRLLHPDQPTRRLQLGCTLFEGATTRRR